ncbi:MAG TPA: sigma-54 dependent transcriptional regulator [Acidobacteriota bacterium]|nr:sigma-54 dependent transcriptional regulator [Acidobacteriota bacterium]
MTAANVLLVDDDKNFLRVLTHHVQEFGHRPAACSSGRVALERLHEEPFDVVITDLKMPQMDGLELLKAVHQLDPDIPVIVLTAHGSIDQAVSAIKAGAYEFLTKPFESEEVELAIDRALQVAGLVKENRELSKAVEEKFEFSGIVGSSGKFREILQLAAQLAEVDTTVLIEGESGTGKELIARAIHYNSARKKKPFVVVNCGAIPENLLESELFGYKRGAFTGAVADKRGKLEAAHTGTVFLDEVGELPMNMQVKLLRLLQEKEVDVIGQTAPRSLDVRILAATNRSLEQMTREGDFREDLYYRLSVAPLQLPPLRERREEIPLLIHHFLDRFNRQFSKNASISQDAVDALCRYDWPGNVRELENIVHRLVVFDRRGRIEADDLPSQFRRPTRTFGTVVFELPEEGFSLEDLERDLLWAALDKHDWNQSQAARYLDISRNTLIYRMQKYDLSPTDNPVAS